MRLWPVLLFLFSWIGFAEANNQLDQSDLILYNKQDFEKSVVEIYNENKKLIGSGTIVNFSGTILTAKHILEDRNESGSFIPNYLLNVLVRTKDGVVFIPAKLLAVHPHVDLAVLSMRRGPIYNPLPVDMENKVETNDDVLLIGHRQSSDQNNQLHKIRGAQVDDTNHHGHIVIGRGVEKGTSGGAAVYNGRLLGVVRSSDIERTIIVPAIAGLDYFRLMGIHFSQEGIAEIKDNIGILANKIEEYENILKQIQSDVNWYARLVEMEYDGNLNEYDVQIYYEQQLSAQPEFDSFIRLFALPVFKVDSDELFYGESDYFSRTDWLLKEDRRVIFSKFSKDLEVFVRNRPESFKQGNEIFLGFDIFMRVESIVGDGFVTKPDDQEICFELRLNSKSGPTVSGTADGVSCTIDSIVSDPARFNAQ